MFVNPIKSLDKTRFGINLNIQDFKCKPKTKLIQNDIVKNVKK